MDNKDTVVVGSFDVTTNLPSQNGGQIVLHGYLYAKDTTEEINARLDQLQDVAKRQFERSGMEMRYAERTKWMKELERNKETYERLAEKTRLGRKLMTQEKTIYDQAEKSRETILYNIKMIEDGIAETKAKFGFT